MPITLNDILNSHRTGQPVVMGILNVTPDSFSDGGDFLDPDRAAAQARRILADGADVIDIGAESTRPGSERISPDDQIARIERVLSAVAATGAVISIDTTSAKVAEFATSRGASIVNDVSAGRDDDQMFPLVADRGVGLVLMHMLGEPKTMQADPQYADVVGEVRNFLAERVDVACAVGVNREKCILDPGIGFGKRVEHNLALLAGTQKLCELGHPVLIGPSRKRFIASLSGASDPKDRLGGTLAACLETYRRGATIFRVHDVQPLRQALTICGAIEPSREA